MRLTHPTVTRNPRATHRHGRRCKLTPAGCVEGGCLVGVVERVFEFAPAGCFEGGCLVGVVERVFAPLVSHLTRCQP